MPDHDIDSVSGHRVSAHNSAPTTLEQAEANLREAVDVGCTDSAHDHVKDYREAVLKAETAKLCGATVTGDPYPCVLREGHAIGWLGGDDHIDVNGETW